MLFIVIFLKLYYCLKQGLLHWTSGIASVHWPFRGQGGWKIELWKQVTAGAESDSNSGVHRSQSLVMPSAQKDAQRNDRKAAQKRTINTQKDDSTGDPISLLRYLRAIRLKLVPKARAQ